MIRRLRDRLLDLLWPRTCMICRRILEREPGMLCPDCRRQMPEPRKGPKRGEHYRRCVSVCSYEGRWREAILRFKLCGRRVYVREFGPLLAGVVRRELEGQFDVVTFVPLSRKRRRQRGYNQSELLGRAVGEDAGVPFLPLLRRVRHTRPQAGIRDAARRRANISNAYQPAESASAVGKRVLLIDDILTSGATLSEASRILLQAGAGSVVCATLALTPRKSQQESR